MKVYDVVQGTQEWLRVRAGVPSASQMHRVITPGGKPSKSAERYLYELAAERLLGRPTVEHVSWEMARGSQLEIQAIRWFEFQRDMDTEPVGFITNDAGTIGASPDRLVGSDGLLEVKCVNEGLHLQYLCQSGSCYEDHKIQCQGQLWIAQRAWVEVLAFHPHLPPALCHVERDEKFIAILEPAVLAFADELERLAKELEAMELGGYRAEREKSLTELLKESLLSLKGA